MKLAKTEGLGPIDDTDLPTKLTTRVLSEGRIHGYAVGGDLACGYRFGEVMLLALTGEAPTEATGRAFEVLLAHLAYVDAGEAAVHAGILGHTCGIEGASLTALVCIGLAARAHAMCEAHRETIEWALAGDSAAPQSAAARAGDDPNAVPLLLEDLRHAGFHPTLPEGIGLFAAEARVLATLGIDSREKLEHVITVAGLTTGFAEALAAPPGAFLSYPMNVPPMVYEDKKP